MIVLTRKSPTQKVLDAALPYACVLTVQNYARPLQQRRRLSGLRGTLRRDLVGLSGIVIGSLALADVGSRSIPSNECHVPCLGALLETWRSHNTVPDPHLLSTSDVHFRPG
jgi:hypothetical protein